jgi:Flp pilus assembly protein TadG
MHNLLRCRRGSAAFATVAALVPLIGAVALGGEFASWYVTIQQAQNAADAAAYSGGLGCANTQSCTSAIAQAAGQPFAQKNGFSNTAMQAVSIGVLSSWNGDNGTFVRAQVSQTQPVYLAAVLGLSNPVSLGATAVAKVGVNPKPPCVLALNGSLSFQGSPTLSSPTCGVASNSTAPDAINFTGNGGLDINAPSFAVGGCSQTGGNQCGNTITYGAPVPNPLSGLDSAMSLLTTSDFSGGNKGQCTSLSAYDTGSCYNNGLTVNNGSLTLNGTYFFNGNVTIGGNATITGTATLVLFGGATLTISGGPTIQLTAPKDHPQLPAPLSSSSVSSLMTDLLIYDPEPYSKNGVNVTGNSNSFFNGTVYVPNSPVTYGGNSSVGTPGCFQVIAYAVTFSGNTKLDDSKCISDGAPGFQVKYVRLVP